MYEINELYGKAKCEAARLCQSVTDDIRDDAIQEYVIAANIAGESGKNKSYQQKAGKSRMIDFLKYEGRRTHGAINPDFDIADKKQLTPCEIIEAKEEYVAAGY